MTRAPTSDLCHHDHARRMIVTQRVDSNAIIGADRRSQSNSTQTGSKRGLELAEILVRSIDFAQDLSAEVFH